VKEAFLQIVNMSISASWLVIAVLLLRLVLKKAPKWANVLLWGFVAVRLICPVSFESALSLIPSAEPIPEQVITNLVVEVPAEIPGFDASNQDPADAPVRDETGDETGDRTDVDFAEQEKQGVPVVTVLTALWAAGVGAMLVYTAVSYFLLRRKVDTAVRFRDNIYQSENVDSPFVLGIAKAKIYLPFRMDRRDLAHVIAHEQAHIRRKDHWWKPFGFVLLAIHWFNPLMWVGYILLCRDIELACDEKVIREMDNETKADYTEALVACSVNRRRIAACPLAFGAVGVKERVKNVMNYKKPAFWIVIAAVALCIVVAVCFLTNPKDYGPEVGDPKLLEFPGINWGSTPEEVIAGLGLTEEQIASQTYSGADSATDSCYLTVVNIPFFGKNASSAEFLFRNSNGKGYRLFRIHLYLDENADMERVNATLTKVYGEGTGEYYLDYIVDNNGALKEAKRGGDPTLNYLANNLPSGYSAKELREAVLSIVNDPEYAIQNWVSSTKGTDVLSADEQELIIKRLESNVNSDRETVLQWLEKAPLVAISTANRSLSAALAEVENTSTLTTDNYIIYDADNLLMHTEMIEYLSGDITPTEPTEEVTPTKSPDLPLLEYPGLRWGMEPYQVKEILGVTEDQILVDEVMATYVLAIKDFTFLGHKVLEGQFNFIAGDSGQYHFSDVTLHFPEETDMAAVKDSLTAFYGPPKDGVGFTRYKVTNIGSVEDYTDDGNTLFFPEDNPVNGWWESEVTLENVLPTEIQDKLARRAVLANNGDEDFADAVREYLRKEPAMLIFCTNGYNVIGIEDHYHTKNVVTLSALTYVKAITD